MEKETLEKFKRQTGLTKENFQRLCEKTEDYLEEERERNPRKRQGLNPTKLSLAERILLTLYYLRHYPTFANLADIFEITESYCHKIYSRYCRILLKVEPLPNQKSWQDKPPATLIIEVTEQPIERPVKRQKSYYSGKKKTYSEVTTTCQCHRRDFIG